MSDSKQLLEMLDDEHRQIAEKLLEQIVDLQKMILVNSIAYYELDENLVSDYKHDQWAKRLQEVLTDNPIAALSPLHYVFRNYTTGTGTSGFDLMKKLTDEDLNKYYWIAQRMVENKREMMREWE